MRQANDGSNLMHGSGRQSDPSGGISAFRGGASMDGTHYDGVPTDKFIVGDSTSEVVRSQDQPNEDLQLMYDRIVGATSAAGMQDRADLNKDAMSPDQNSTAVEGGTLILNPTIN